ncbi:MAG: MATE family efflux transporter [Lachnospiraceae bacterium]|nr:MATE family efflux transporter [Lachnospiraceae bacterium]
MKQLKLFQLAWPIFVETALFMLLGFADVFVLSKYDDLAASSVNTANQALSIVTIVFTVVSGASAVLISQYLGAEKRQDASRIAALSIAFHFAAGLIISAVLVLWGRSILSFIGAKGKILEYAGQYLSIVGGFIFLQAVLSSMSVIIRNHGMTQISMYVTVGMNIVNTGLDIVFVLGLFGLPKMGVMGVAIATSLSRIAGTVVLAVVLFKNVEKLSIFQMLRPFPFKDVRDILKIGVPSATETFLYNLSQLVITSMVLNCLTEAELVTKTYVQNITMFFYIFSVAIGQASQIITGHLVGADEMEEAYRQCLRSYRNAIMITLAACMTGVLFRNGLMGIFTADREVIRLGAHILLIDVLLEMGRTTNLVVIACLRGAGDVFFPTGCAIFSMWLISVLGAYILAVVFGMGIYGLWAALAADECLRGVLMLWRWQSRRWQSKRFV